MSVLTSWRRLTRSEKPGARSRRALTLLVLVALMTAAGLGGLGDGGRAAEAGASASPDPGAARLPDARQLTQEAVEEQARSLDTSEVENYLQQINNDLSGYIPPLTLKNILGLFTGRGSGYSFRDLVAGLWRYLARELVTNGKLLGKIVLLAVICAILANLGSAFEHNNVGSLAYYVCYMVMMGIALGSFAMAVGVARSLIDQLAGFLFALLPSLIAMLAATGALVSAGLLHPLMIATTNGTVLVVRDYVFPVLFFAAVVDVVSSLSEGIRVSNLVALLRQVAITIMGLLFALFLGVSAVQGAAGAVGDGVTVRTAKFMANTFIPVVGKMFADASEVVIGSSLVLKNALGLLGALGVLLLAAAPLLKMVALVLIYRLAAAMVQPLNAGRIGDLLNNMGTALVQVLLCTGLVSVMFFVGITIIIAAGNMAAMMR